MNTHRIFVWLTIAMAGLFQGSKAWANEWRIGKDTYFQNTADGLVIGNVKNGWRLRIQRYSPSGEFAYGHIIGASFSKCGWVRVGALSAPLDSNVYRECPDSVGDVGNNFNAYSGSGVTDGIFMPNTSTAQNAGCVGYDNLDGSGAGNPTGSAKAISNNLRYRYTTNDGHWALVRDDSNTSGNNWVFIPVGCIQVPASTYPEFYVDLVLVSQANGRIVTAENGGGAYLIANRAAIGPWERFHLNESLSSGSTINIRVSNNQFVTAENGGGGAVNANRNAASVWETFTAVKLNNNNSSAIGNGDSLALRTYDGSHYLCAEDGGASPINATRTGVGAWESFTAWFVSNGYP
jgi:hypothetical protein